MHLLRKAKIAAGITALALVSALSCMPADREEDYSSAVPDTDAKPTVTISDYSRVNLPDGYVIFGNDRIHAVNLTVGDYETQQMVYNNKGAGWEVFVDQSGIKGGYDERGYTESDYYASLYEHFMPEFILNPDDPKFYDGLHNKYDHDKTEYRRVYPDNAEFEPNRRKFEEIGEEMEQGSQNVEFTPVLTSFTDLSYTEKHFRTGEEYLVNSMIVSFDTPFDFEMRFGIYRNTSGEPQRCDMFMFHPGTLKIARDIPLGRYDATGNKCNDTIWDGRRVTSLETPTEADLKPFYGYLEAMGIDPEDIDNSMERLRQKAISQSIYEKRED